MKKRLILSSKIQISLTYPGPFVKSGAYACNWILNQQFDDIRSILCYHMSIGRDLTLFPKAPVQRTITAKEASITGHQGRKPHGSGRFEGQKGFVGFYLRAMEEESFYDAHDVPMCHWKPRGKLMTTARLVYDWDWFEDRSRHSTGWKDHRCRYQWEHHVREKEKHMKNRARKALARGENCQYLFS